MTLNAATLWWIVAGALVALELASGTFYLLMMALGASTAALAAHAGLGLSGQLVTAAIVGGGAVAAWYAKRRHTPQALPPEADRDVNLDIGERVQVDAWASEGSTTVQYRGASWRARWAGAGAPVPGTHRIRAVEGSTLMLERIEA